MKCRPKVGNSCYYSVQTLVSSRLHSKKIRETIVPVVLYGCGIWSLALRGKYRPRIFEYRILRRIFEPKKDENGE